MPVGLKHTEETKKLISEAAKGKGKGGFNKKVNCPVCQQEMSPANLGKHENVCRDSRGLFLNNKELLVNEIKILRRRLKNYNITVEEYIKLHNEQEGKCKLCKRDNGKRNRLSVDHCHSTGIVRGLLCDKCNMAIGLFDNNVTLLNETIKYLNNAS